MNELMASGTSRTMDSREIAALTGKAHRNVVVDIETQIGKLPGGVQGFQHTYQNEQNGQTYRCFQLPYRETMILVSGYSVELRAKVVDRWMELEAANLPKVLTGPALLAAALIEANATMERQVKQIEQMKPAVQFYNDVTGSRDAIDMGQAAKVLGMGVGRNNLFELLREKKILRDNNEPYQKYIDNGWFRVVEQKFQDAKGEWRINIKTLVFQTGIDGISKIIRETQSGDALF